MPSVKDKIAEQKAQEPALRRNPEVDAKIDKYMAENPGLVESYEKHTKEELIRKLVLNSMRRSEYINNRNDEIRAWVEERPEIKAKIEEKIKNVPEASRNLAFMNAAKREVVVHAMRPQG